MKKMISAALCTVFFVYYSSVGVLASEVQGNRNENTGEKEEITYAQDVYSELLEEKDAYTLSTEASVCEVLIPRSEKTAQIATGDHIILPANEENPAGAALKVVGVSEDEDGNLLWSCEEPEELSDFIESFDISGMGEFLPGQAVGAEESIHARGIGIHAGNQMTEAGRIDFDFNNTFLSESVVFNGMVSVEISSIEYRLKMDVGVRETTVEDFYFAVNNTVYVSGDFSLRTEGLSQGGEAELGTVPFVLGRTGVNGQITFWMTYDVNGNVCVSYSLSSTAGLTWENGAVRTFAEHKSTFASALGFDFSAGPKMQFVLKFGKKINLLDVTVDAGLKGNVRTGVTGSEPFEAGYRMDAYVYLNMIPGENGIVNKALGLKETALWDYETSPYHMVFAGIQ